MIVLQGGIGGLLNLKQAGQDYAYLYDGKGNVAAVLDGNQAVVAAYRYAPFDKLLAKTGSLTQPFGFSTKRYDEQTGLIYYGYRFYGPEIGRWTTRDPLAEAGGMNLYAFVGNNPVNWVDPWGLAHFVLIHTPDTNLGRNPERAAQTRAKELRQAGHTVDVSAVNTVAGFVTAITGGSFIDGGVSYFGHSGDPCRGGGIYLGTSNGVRQAIDQNNIGQLSNSNLGSEAEIELIACFTAVSRKCGKSSVPAAAQMFHDQLQRPVWGSPVGVSFRGPDKVWLPDGQPPEGDIDIYMMPDGRTKMQRIPPK